MAEGGGREPGCGKADGNGVAKGAQGLDYDFEDCPNEHGLFGTGRKPDEKGVVDTAFVFSGWQKGIESWRFNLPTGRGAELDVRAATVFDRTLFRAGETVSMKHFVRFETSSSVGWRSSSATSSRSAREIFVSRSRMCTGIRIVRDLLATPRCTACRIHHVAFVENL